MKLNAKKIKITVIVAVVVAIIAVVAVVLFNSTAADEKNDSETTNEITQNPEDADKGGTSPDSVINDEVPLAFSDIFDMFGKPYSEVEKRWGKPVDCVRYNEGLFFRFKNDVSFVFEGETDETASEPNVDSVCYACFAPLNQCIVKMDVPLAIDERVYAVEELERRLKKDIECSWNEVDNCYGHVFEVYGELTCIIESQSPEEVQWNSTVFIKPKE